MEWHQISGFYHVARLGSFTRASEAVFRTQSALTQQVKALEEELGCQLFERIGKRKLLLTPAGEMFLKFSEAVLDRYESLVEGLDGLKGLQQGRLRIAAPFTTLYHLLPRVLQEYEKQFPRVELLLLDRSHSIIMELVKNGDVDFGITLESLAPDNFTKIRWKRVEPVLLTPVGHPLVRKKQVAMKDIAEYPLILPPKSAEYSNRRSLEKLFQMQNLGYRVVMESSNVELSSLYVEMGLGISFATVDMDCLPRLKQRKLAFMPLSRYFKPGYIAVVFRRDRPITPIRGAFLNILLGQTHLHDETSLTQS